MLRGYVRAAAGGTLIFGSAAFLNVFLICFYPLRRRLGPLCIQALAQAFLKIANVRIQRQVHPSVGSGRHRTLIVANHLCFLDIVVLSAVFGAVFVSKKAVRSWPVVGAFGWLSGIRFLDRSRMAQRLSLVKDLAADPPPESTALVVFPQGTTSSRSENLPFSKGIFKVVELNPQIRLLPVTLVYVDEADLAWSGERFLTHAIGVLNRPKICVTVVTHPQVSIAAYTEKGVRGVAAQVEQTVKAPLFAG